MSTPTTNRTAQRRRLTADLCGVISTSRDGYQVVCNLVRGTTVTFLRGADGRRTMEADGKEFRLDGALERRVMRASVPA